MTKKSTKRALALSIVALALCVSMLVGTTYAWFTDSAESTGNIIKSGTLNVDLGIKTAEDADYVSVKADPSKKAFDYDRWEPGYTEWVNAAVSTKGNLALKYVLRIIPNGEVSALADVIDVYYVAEEVALPAARDLSALTRIGTLAEVIAGTATVQGTLTPDLDLYNGTAVTASQPITLAMQMQESAGNEYQDLAIGTDFALQIIATQLTYEEDSFGPDYDEEAELPSYVLVYVDDQGAVSYADEEIEVAIEGLDNVDEGDAVRLVKEVVDLEEATAKFEVADGETAIAGIDLSLVDSSNNKVTFENGLATVTVNIIPGLDVANLSVKYNGDGEDGTIVSYDAETGELVFTATHFSEYVPTYEGTWYYLPATGRAYTDYDDICEAIMIMSEEACGELLDKLNIDEIVAGYEYLGYTLDEHNALLTYLIAGDWGFTSEFLAFEDFEYTVAGTTTQDLKAIHDAYLAVYDAEFPVITYPTLENGFYASVRPMGIEPFEAEW